ncbi:MAG: patatin-like phospholipase family protein [Gammaproteobacteria bacterium]|jgi:NTE family protein|nr:patatin-like phospholipase family protein [Gammaproteobacteria bacterium]
MVWERAIACALLLVVTSAGVQAAGDPVAPSRPRIGLVLGGGGAKGAAHIGVLRVLDELRVPVDCVAGTSMGALIGGTFASGMPPAEIEKAVLGINWSRTVGSEGLRDRTPIDRKLSGITYTNSLDLGIRNGTIEAPGGLLKSQDIEDVIRSLVSDARFTRNFDHLPVPFRAVATDMMAGEMVVLGEGDLSVAMRASMAVPGAFSPVVQGNRVLSDGGMMRNLPVDIARELCAEVVIAVSLASPPPEPADLASAVALAGRSLDVMINANQNAQIATLANSDVSIVVQMGDIGSSDFQRVPDAIPLGREAALRQKQQLERLALPEAEYLAWRQGVDRAAQPAIRLADVRIKGLSRVNEDYVRAQLQNIRPGATVTTAEIQADTGRVFALGDFERVEYHLVGPADARILDVGAIEKSWGPDFVRFDLGLAANGSGRLEALLRADHERTWINPLGGRWHNALQLGEQTILQTDLYQPFDVRQRFFIQPTLQYQRDLENIYDDGDRIASYIVREAFAQLDLGVNFGTSTQLRAGLRESWIGADRDTGLPILPELKTEKDASAQFGLIYDTRDAPGMPTNGTFINARYARSNSWLGGRQDYDLVEGVLLRAITFRGDPLTLFVGGGAELDGDLPVTEEFQLGGIRTFPGLQPGELRGSKYWFAGTRQFWKLADIQSLFGQALYGGVRLHAGRMGERIDGVRDGTLYGIAASLGGATPIGPFILSLGYVDNDSWQLQFALGRPISEGSILDELR